MLVSLIASTITQKIHMSCFTIRLWAVCLGFLGLSVSLQAQFGPGPAGGANMPMDSSGIDKPLGDTTAVRYRYVFRPELGEFSRDSQLRYFHHEQLNWGEADSFSLRRLDLGLPGTPLRPFLWHLPVRQGLRLGLEGFAPYSLNRENLAVYEIGDNKPYTDLYYSQVNMRNRSVRVNFAHQIKPRLYYSLHYSLADYLGLYAFQRLRNNNLGGVMRYQSASGRYRLHFHALSYSVRRQENGGVVVQPGDTLGGIASNFLVNVPIQSDSGRAQFAQIDLMLWQTWVLSGAKAPARDSADSLAPPAKLQGWTAQHRLAWRQEDFKFYNRLPSGSYYGPFLANPRGLRHALYLRTLENELALQSPLNEGFNLRVYAQHRLHFLEQEPLEFMVQDIFAGLQLWGQPGSKGLRYRLKGQGGLGDGRFNALIEAGFRLPLLPWLGLEGDFQAQQYSPSRIEQRVYISPRAIWDNPNWGSPRDWQLGGALTTRWGSRLELRYIGMNNALFSDEQGLVQQANDLQTVAQFGFRQTYRLGILEGSHAAYWQVSQGSALRLPQWMMEHSLALEGTVFKYMRLRGGINMRWWARHSLMGYMPVTGQFMVQDQIQMQPYPLLDAFISFRLWRFRFFFKAENGLQLLNEENHFHAWRYPNPNFWLRFGFSWPLFN